MSDIPHVNANDFQAEVLNSSEPVLVDFYAEWCQPCLRQGPVLEQYLSENPGAKSGKVSVDNDVPLAHEYQVSSIPTLIVFQGGREVTRHRGFANKDYVAELLKSA